MDPAEDEDKETQIRRACGRKDTATLAALARSEGGLRNDVLRRVAWPLLLGVHPDAHDETPDWNCLEQHRDESQVQLDVSRSFTYYPADESEDRMSERRRQLFEVIATVLRCHPRLCYFQGYHDIVQVLLLVLGAGEAVPAAARLSLLRIRDFMLPTMTGAISQLRVIPAILRAADPALHRHVAQTEPFFALAATLTLYAHDVQSYHDIVRLFDFLLATEAGMALYLYVAIILSRRKELLDVDPDEPDILHFTLSKLPQPLDLEVLIQSCLKLHQQHPPERLPGNAWTRVSNCSVLKTTRELASLQSQSLSDGERFFERQAKEIRWQDATTRLAQRTQLFARRYRRPATAAGFAILAATLAFYMRRPNIPPMFVDLGLLASTLEQRVLGSIRYLTLLVR